MEKVGRYNIYRIRNVKLMYISNKTDSKVNILHEMGMENIDLPNNIAKFINIHWKQANK